MCGLFGIIGKASDAHWVPMENQLWESARRLHHRGPDASAVFANPGIGLAHTRLSFLDVDARAHQPFWDPDHRYALVFNGEIYNFLELRAGLEQRGVRFRTGSDTEVLLQSLINDDSAEVLPRLIGMFAFAFWDSATASLLLARDRFGMKPLFVAEDAEKILFASEVKALRPWITPAADPYTVTSYLLGFGGPMRGFTFFNGVRALAPGGVVRFRRGQASQWGSFFSLPQFWTVDDLQAARSLSTSAAIDRLDERLQASVKRHMFADVPVGAFCSGGVDSSLILAMAARTYANLAIFHADVRGRWSEHHAAAALAKHLKLDLKTVDVEECDFVERMPDVMHHYEHPFTYHPNCAPLMMVSELARANGVKGLLSGEGSDECFLGYPWLGRKRLTDAYERFGAAARRLVHRIPSVGRIVWPYQGNAHEIVRALTNRREIEDERAATRIAARKFGGTLTNRDLWSIDYMGHHLRTLLHRNDTMGMSASIEARFPFLDHDVVALAANLPASQKLRFDPTVWEKAHPFVRDKWVVRKVADRHLPRAFSRRIKVGFWTTVYQRMDVDPAYFDESFTRDLFQLTRSQMAAIYHDADQDLRMRLLHLDVWGRVCLAEEPRDVSRRLLQKHVTIRAE